MITPADIENKVFAKAVRGYKEEEVDDFLDLIILDMEKLMKENRQLKKELEKMTIEYKEIYDQVDIETVN